MTTSRALILGGTGMLAGVAEALTGDRWRVVLPSRHYSPIDTSERESAQYASRERPHDARTDDLGRAIWVAACWEQPADLASRSARALDGPANLLVAWIHHSYRRQVLGAVTPLLAPSAPVVEVSSARVAELPDPLLAKHPTQQVVLGAVSGHDSTRALPHAEIVDGVLAAVRAALRGAGSSLHQVGQPRPLGQ